MSTFIKTPNIVTDGLVLYFDAGNKKSYNNRTNVLSQSETFSDTAVWSSLNVITLYNNSAYTESMLSIDLNNGTITNISNVIKSTSTDIGNGWWRVTLTFNSNEWVIFRFKK